GGDGGGVRGGEEEEEVAGSEEVGGVDEVTGGEVGLGNEGHAEAPGEAAGRVGGVAAPELHVVETLHPEPVRPGVRTDEVGEAHQLEAPRRFGISVVVVIFVAHFGFFSCDVM
ncbi:hypothetical protein PanWU01x14_211800, partial [Parasponia andersonii]